jgi:hypothetical protein
MVRKYHLVGVAAAVLFAGAGMAKAGDGYVQDMTLVTFSGDTDITVTGPTTDPLPNGHHWLTWSIDGNGMGHIGMIDHAPSGDLAGDAHTYYQDIVGDPKSVVTTDEYNYSDVAWNAFDVSVSVPASMVGKISVAFDLLSPITSSSTTAWLDTPTKTSNFIEFSGASTNSPLAVNDDSTLTYTIVITPINGYRGAATFCITSTPIEVPEAASLGLLALGGLGLVMRRRGR